MKSIMDADYSIPIEMMRNAVPRYLLCHQLHETELTLTQALQAYLGPTFDEMVATLTPVAVAKVARRVEKKL
jgi:hypothetical protein